MLSNFLFHSTRDFFAWFPSNNWDKENKRTCWSIYLLSLWSLRPKTLDHGLYTMKLTKLQRAINKRTKILNLFFVRIFTQVSCHRSEVAQLWWRRHPPSRIKILEIHQKEIFPREISVTISSPSRGSLWSLKTCEKIKLLDVEALLDVITIIWQHEIDCHPVLFYVISLTQLPIFW